MSTIKKAASNDGKISATKHKPASASFTIDADVIRTNIRLTNEMINIRTIMHVYVEEIRTLKTLYSKEKIENDKKASFIEGLRKYMNN